MPCHQAYVGSPRPLPPRLPTQIRGAALALCAEPGRHLTEEEYDALDDVMRGELMDCYENGLTGARERRPGLAWPGLAAGRPRGLLRPLAPLPPPPPRPAVLPCWLTPRSLCPVFSPIQACPRTTCGSPWPSRSSAMRSGGARARSRAAVRVAGWEGSGRAARLRAGGIVPPSAFQRCAHTASPSTSADPRPPPCRAAQEVPGVWCGRAPRALRRMPSRFLLQRGLPASQLAAAPPAHVRGAGGGARRRRAAGLNA